MTGATHPFRLALFALCVASCLSCQPTQSPFSATTILLPEKGGDFRGIHMGDTPRTIKRNEQATSVYSMPDELIYRFQSKELQSAWYEISYNFNQDGLNHIHLDVYPGDTGTEAQLIKDFTEYYNDRFGFCDGAGPHKEWRSLTEHGRLISISLMQSAGKENRRCLKLIFNESNP